MADAEIVWPEKQRELRNQFMDSRVWDDFAIRDDDVIVGTYAKAGTTWMQQIVSQLIFNGAEGVDVAGMSPWVDALRPPPTVKLPQLEAQTHRRFLKTHLPASALRYSPRAKYIYVARDGRDVLWSLHNHHSRTNDEYYEIMNNAPDRVGPPVDRPGPDVRQYFLDWLEGDGFPFWSFWEHTRSWWDLRHLPNLLLAHFNDLKRDLPGQIRRVAEFLDIAIDESVWPAILEHCSFDYMRAHAELSAPLGGAVWVGGAKTFIHKGTNGRWRNVLTADDVRAYEETAVRELGPDCARWLANGDTT